MHAGFRVENNVGLVWPPEGACVVGEEGCKEHQHINTARDDLEMWSEGEINIVEGCHHEEALYAGRI